MGPMGIATPININIQSSWLLLESLALAEIHYNIGCITDKYNTACLYP